MITSSIEYVLGANQYTAQELSVRQSSEPHFPKQLLITCSLRYSIGHTHLIPTACITTFAIIMVNSSLWGASMVQHTSPHKDTSRFGWEKHLLLFFGSYSAAFLQFLLCTEGTRIKVSNSFSHSLNSACEGCYLLTLLLWNKVFTGNKIAICHMVWQTLMRTSFRIIDIYVWKPCDFSNTSFSH